MSSLDNDRGDGLMDDDVARLLELRLSEQERAELLKRMAADDQACNRFADHMMLHAALRREIGAPRPATLGESMFNSGVAASPSAVLTEVAEFHPLADSGRPSPVLGYFTFGALGWTLLAAMMAVIASLWWTDGWRPNVKVQAKGGKHQNASKTMAGAKVLEVSSLRLESGTANLRLPAIGYVVVEGPAELDLLDPMRARLTRGRIKVRVTEPAGRGFVVETPYGNVMDLGTEFGLDVSDDGQAGVVVFDGAVDLQIAESDDNPNFSRVERLVRGEGLKFSEGGKLDRIMSIVTGSSSTFQSRIQAEEGGHKSVIADVVDNRRTTETKKFYEIVPAGFREDAYAYVDRPEHQWNGITKAGIPKYLIGADYVKPFNDDKVQRNIEIKVTLACPAKLYVFFDNRLRPPPWLTKGFRKTKDKIGLDVGKWGSGDKNYSQGDGPGNSIDNRFTIWERTVSEAGVVTLGANGLKSSTTSAMYGIAAVALDQATAAN